MTERLQKILSQYGVASRRQAEGMIVQGRVTVNGETAQLGQLADPVMDEIKVDGKVLETAPEAVYYMLNKPRGYVTTLQDEQGRKHVGDLMADCGQRVYPVGRLDLNSEGLLLMTNDGELTNRLTHPKEGYEKVYHVWVNGFTQDALKILTSSILIDGKMTVPAKVRILSQKKTTLLEFTLFEGRNRQIRRLCEAAGVTVTRLKRVEEGPLHLGDLPVGKWRKLTDEEIGELKEFLQNP